MKKWCVWLFLISSFFSGLAIYYVVIRHIARMEYDLSFSGIDDD
ncbi:hypothetical protein ACQLT9_005820 [Salmonella enterica subsp. diarizonae]